MTVYIICSIGAVLFTGWLFGFSGWIPGKDARVARNLRQKIGAEVPTGTPRAAAEAFLKREGIVYTYYSPGDTPFADLVEAADKEAGVVVEAAEGQKQVPVTQVGGFTDSSLDTRRAMVPDHGERVFLRLVFDRKEKCSGINGTPSRRASKATTGTGSKHRSCPNWLADS